MKTYNIKLSEKKKINEDVIVLSFPRPEDFEFKAGQFVMFKIIKEGETKNRAYSVFSPPLIKEELHFCIKFVPEGFASKYFRTVKKGEMFEMKGPFGEFVFDDKAVEHWFIGSGSGITPLHCMIKENITKYSNKKFKLIFGAKTKQDLIFHEEFLKLAEENENFDYLPTLTREEWEGRTGRVHTHLEGDLQNKTFYICGIKQLIESTKEVLLQEGVKSKNIKFEAY